MSDQDLAAHVAQLRAWHEQTDESLVSLAEVIEGVIEQVRASPTIGVIEDMKLGSLRHAISAVKQRHQSDRAR
jgi:hypothetical protein